MSAQKTALVCLMVLILAFAGTVVRNAPTTSASVVIGQHKVAFNVCVRSGVRGEPCALSLAIVDTRR